MTSTWEHVGLVPETIGLHKGPLEIKATESVSTCCRSPRKGNHANWRRVRSQVVEVGNLKAELSELRNKNSEYEGKM